MRLSVLLSCCLLLSPALANKCAAAMALAPSSTAFPSAVAPDAASQASPWGASARSAEPLALSDAFSLEESSTVNETGQSLITLRLVPAQGYAIYRDRVELSLGDEWTLQSAPLVSEAQWKDDAVIGRTQVYLNPVSWRLMAAKGTVRGASLKIQGCLIGRICYPPLRWNLFRDASGWKVVRLAVSSAASPSVPYSAAAPASGSSATVPVLAKSSPSLKDQLAPTPTAFSWLAFLGAGLLLALAPCNLPLVPVVVLTICPQGKNETLGFRLSRLGAYTAGQSLVLASAGAALAWFGFNLRLWTQADPVQIIASLLLSALALGTALGWPQSIRNPFAQRFSSLKFSGSTIGAAFGVGSLAAVFAGACAAPVLSAALLDVAANASPSQGLLRLGLLGITMTWPLWLYGVFGTRLRIGKWSAVLQYFWVLAIAALAIVWLSRWLSPSGVLIFGVLAIFIWGAMVSRPWNIGRPLLASASLFALVLSFTFFVSPKSTLLPWRVVHSSASLAAALKDASAKGCPAVVQVSASWCAECNKMQRSTFAAAALARGWQNYVPIELDVSEVTPDLERALSEHRLVGPPATIWYSQGVERARWIGAATADELIAHTPSMASACHI
jgi:thiol:disulfide interchange protein DsbD